MKLAAEDFRGIRNWFYRNARPLELAKWQFHFENGGEAAVVKALAAYQNEDGGFGNALEPDAWNPYSSPLQTATGTDVLLEIGFEDKDHPVVQGILRYLDSGAEMDGDNWRNVIASNNAYPHAPWWNLESDSTARNIFNPTANLAGFILLYADRDSALFTRGLRIAKELEALFLQEPGLEMHPLKCVLTLLEYIALAGLQEQFAYEEMNTAAEQRITALLQRDAGDWTGYTCKPSFFIQKQESLGYVDNAAIVEKELDYTLENRNREGVWNLNWRWAGYEREFAVSENWWKGWIALEKLLFLRAFGRLAE
ncbi:hypothetical protein NST84_10700 [Paenibacillus sp. FSL R7-0345]|uniref:hypothetical protein n=1 Tax=Paenibacillus sp. FSL R7-0345 TaxID=2954535 RepID=UPI00315A46C8